MNPELTLQLVDNHRQFLAFLERRLGDRALAEDILQDAFVKSLQKDEDARDETSSVAWFYRTLRNAIIDHYRRSGTRSRALELLARELADAVEPPPELRDEICGCVTRLASTLKPEYEAAIRRIDVEGAHVQDFAAEAGITPNNASVAYSARVKRCGSRSRHPAGLVPITDVSSARAGRHSPPPAVGKPQQDFAALRHQSPSASASSNFSNFDTVSSWRSAIRCE